MRMILRLIPVLFISAGIAVLASIIPQLGGSTHVGTDEKFPVVSEVIKLTSYNLVDQFSGLALYHKLDRIDWNGRTLQVEINVGEQLTSAQSVFDDLFTLSSFSFAQVDNVDTLLVRVLAEGDRGSRWILMLNASKSAWDAEEAKLAAKNTDLIKSFMKDHFHFTMSPVWQKIEAL